MSCQLIFSVEYLMKRNNPFLLRLLGFGEQKKEKNRYLMLRKSFRDKTMEREGFGLLKCVKLGQNLIIQDVAFSEMFKIFNVANFS